MFVLRGLEMTTKVGSVESSSRPIATPPSEPEFGAGHVQGNLIKRDGKEGIEGTQSIEIQWIKSCGCARSDGRPM